VVVYAGAVMVLFLFIIMLLDTGERHRSLVHGFNLLLGIVSAVLLIIGALWLAGQFPVTVTPPLAPMMPPDNNPLAYASSAKAFALACSRATCCRSRSPASCSSSRWSASSC